MTVSGVAETVFDRELADTLQAERMRRGSGKRRRRQEAALFRLEQAAGVRSAAEREAFHRIYAACGEMSRSFAPTERFRRVDQAAGVLRMLRQRGVFDAAGERERG